MKCSKSSPTGSRCTASRSTTNTRSMTTYGKVLDLQAREIRASLEERKQAAEEERRSQAAKVTAWLARSDAADTWEAWIRNASDLPIFDVRTFFHKIHGSTPNQEAANGCPSAR